MTVKTGCPHCPAEASRCGLKIGATHLICLAPKGHAGACVATHSKCRGAS